MRRSASGIINDLMRRVAALESKQSTPRQASKDVVKVFTRSIPGLSKSDFNSLWDAYHSEVLKEEFSNNHDLDYDGLDILTHSEFEGTVVMAFEKPRGYQKQHLALFEENAVELLKYFDDKLQDIILDEAEDGFFGEGIKINKVRFLKASDDRVIKLVYEIDVESDKPEWAERRDPNEPF